MLFGCVCFGSFNEGRRRGVPSVAAHLLRACVRACACALRRRQPAQVLRLRKDNAMQSKRAAGLYSHSHAHTHRLLNEKGVVWPRTLAVRQTSWLALPLTDAHLNERRRLTSPPPPPPPPPSLRLPYVAESATPSLLTTSTVSSSHLLDDTALSTFSTLQT